MVQLNGVPTELPVNTHILVSKFAKELTSSICRTRVSVALSEMLPTKTVVATFISAAEMTGTWERGGVGGYTVDMDQIQSTKLDPSLLAQEAGQFPT